MKIHSIASNVVDILIKHHFRLFGVRPAAILLLSGKRSDEPNLYPIDETTKKIWIHLMDYDIYLEQHQHATDPKPGRYAVFLDEYVPFHPDYKYMRVEPPVSADEYYPKLRSFFEFLENKFDLQVIIAAHPRSDYKDKQEYFGNRIVVRGKTAQLVRDSVFVIAHMSTAIDFAVLFRKPLIFITTEKISRIQSGSYPFGRYIDTTAAAFQKKPVIVDNMKDINWNSEMNVEDVVYQDYKNAFIKKDGTADLPFWKIFADYIHTQ